MLATLESPVPARFAHMDEQEELGRALLKSVSAREGATFTVDVPNAAAVTDLITGLRSWLMVVGAGTGVASATVSPTFLGETFPAMLALVRELERAAGGSGVTWQPSGPRTIQVGKAKHVFVSRDRPVAGKTPNPDGIVEVVDAQHIDRDWFFERVSPRCQALGLTRVFYGVARCSRIDLRRGPQQECEQRRRGRPASALRLAGVPGFHRPRGRLIFSQTFIPESSLRSQQ